jgi:hypothetical protein
LEENWSCLTSGELDVIITTVFGEGKDIPQLDRILRVYDKEEGRPVSVEGVKFPSVALTQLFGRLTRKYPNKKAPLFIDVINRRGKSVMNASLKRMESYRLLGLSVVQVFQNGDVIIHDPLPAPKKVGLLEVS